MSDEPSAPAPEQPPAGASPLGGDGPISGFELKVALNSLGYGQTQGDIERLILDLDPQNTGTIDFDRFAELIAAKMAARDEIDQIQMAFDMLDGDRTGRVSFKNLQAVAKELGETLSDQELHEMINEADADNDGEISFDEFAALVRAAKLS
jgi:centrin-1